ncbi:MULTISPECIES: DUF721 domain-containing protein [unclassified Prochlorococcus]|uniref:DUF721 domain-containing protein n=1 Tax=unclassified Prochlorococcus TaxID=2627481 RepID=UPI0005339993|nr:MULTISPECIES: DUF721 domain-containing protein [unclassified Prochlorococcus]KGG16529.1 Zn-ribbon-containing [Prochlorococcus sp. MIT 0602]KGG16995.1 Zn-ribbon-containing [Prochlorococcus sp. MIT 0603]
MNFDDIKKIAENNRVSQTNSKVNDAYTLSQCLNHLKVEWNKNKSITALWQDWPRIVGDKLASNCTLLTFQGGVLTIGAQHPQWRQALIFNRSQLLASLRAEGHKIKDLRIKQYYPKKHKFKQNEQDIWKAHPSRADIHGKSICPICKSPSPAGEISLWKKCCLCRRKELSTQNSE